MHYYIGAGQGLMGDLTSFRVVSACAPDCMAMVFHNVHSGKGGLYQVACDACSDDLYEQMYVMTIMQHWTQATHVTIARPASAMVSSTRYPGLGVDLDGLSQFLDRSHTRFSMQPQHGETIGCTAVEGFLDICPEPDWGQRVDLSHRPQGMHEDLYGLFLIGTSCARADVHRAEAPRRLVEPLRLFHPTVPRCRDDRSYDQGPSSGAFVAHGAIRNL